MKLCEHCGATIHENSDWCPKCGRPVSENAAIDNLVLIISQDVSDGLPGADSADAVADFVAATF